MLSIDSLFLLVRSLTKVEKRYFRLQAGFQRGEKSYLQLFDCLDGATAFDETLRAELAHRFPGTTLEPARKQLAQVLLRALRQFESRKSVEARWLEAIENSRILHVRGLVEAAFGQLGKAKSLALNAEQFSLYVLAARRELSYRAQAQFPGLSEADLVEQHEKLRDLLDHEASAFRHAALYDVLLLRYWRTGLVRGERNTARLNDLLLEEHRALTAQRIRSFAAAQRHLQFQSVYFLMTGNPAGSLAVFRELDALFQRHPALWATDPLHYVQLLDGILHDLRVMARPEEMPFFLDRLRAVPSPSESFAAMNTALVTEYELLRAVDTAQAELARHGLRDLAGIPDRTLNLLPYPAQARLRIAAARAWLLLGEPASALPLLNAVLNQPARLLSLHLRTVAVLLSLQTHAALGNTDYLTYALRAAERNLRTDGRTGGLEGFVIKQLRFWMQNRPRGVGREIPPQLLENPYDRLLACEIRLTEWLAELAAKRPALIR